jgi:protein KRI1
MPTRFKYTRSKPTAFGLTPAEILLATDKELDAIAGLRHIAPYRKQGLGMQGRGISKRIYDLKQTLKNRKWGEEMEADEDGKPRTMARDAGWSGKRKSTSDGGDKDGEASRKKKRLGKNQRKREREANGWVAPEGGAAEASAGSANRFEGGEQAEEVKAASSAPVDAVDGEKEGKKRRKKKSSQKQDELKIFD